MGYYAKIKNMSGSPEIVPIRRPRRLPFSRRIEPPRREGTQGVAVDRREAEQLDGLIAAMASFYRRFWLEDLPAHGLPDRVRVALYPSYPGTPPQAKIYSLCRYFPARPEDNRRCPDLLRVFWRLNSSELTGVNLLVISDRTLTLRHAPFPAQSFVPLDRLTTQLIVRATKALIQGETKIEAKLQRGVQEGQDWHWHDSGRSQAYSSLKDFMEKLKT